MQNHVVLDIQNVSKVINGHVIIDDLNFQLHKGEVLGLLGPNGSGKTTTMRMIVGLMKPSIGDVLIEGASIQSNFHKAISYIGSMIETPAFYPFYSGYQNLMYFASMSKGVSKNRVQEVIELLGLTNAIHKKFSTYSLGMKQRLGIAQALLHNPTILILDEPTNGLDPAGIREIRDYLKLITKTEGTSILISSHLLSEIELICDRAVIIQNGKYIKEVEMNKDPEECVNVIFEMNNPELALRVLTTNDVGSLNINQKGENKILINMVEVNVPSIVELLVTNGVQIKYIYREKETLEDVFIQATGGNVIE
jgi:ABC-2 type transport system ATP-binding protein